MISNFQNTSVIELEYVTQDIIKWNTNALSFYVTKTVLVGPKWLWPKLIGQVQIVIFYQNESHLDLTIHFGPDHFILVMTKSLWSSPNQCG